MLLVGDQGERKALDSILRRTADHIVTRQGETTDLIRAHLGAVDIDLAICVERGDDEAIRQAIDSIRAATPELPIIVVSRCPEPPSEDRWRHGEGITVVTETESDDYGSLRDQLQDRLPGQSTEAGDPAIRLRAAISNTKDGVVTIDETSTIRFANQSVEAIFGHSPESLIGEPLTKLMADRTADRHLAAVDRYLETGEKTLDWGNVQLMGRHADGHDIPLAISFGEFDEEGIHYFTGIIRDISEHHERAQELSMKDRAMEEAPVGILITKQDPPEYPVEFANRAFEELTGYDEAEIQETNAAVLGADETNPETVEKLRAALRNERPINVELLNRRKDGTLFWNDVELAPLRDASGHATHVVSFHRDVTDRKRRERRIAGLNAIMEQFIEAEQPEDVCRIMVDAGEQRLDIPVIDIALFDDERSELRSVARTTAAEAYTDEGLLAPDGQGWKAFVDGKSKTVAISAEPGASDTAPIDHLTIRPLGKYGIVIVGSPTAPPEFVETVSDNLYLAIERIDRETRLRESEALLEDQNAWLRRVNRINDIVRSIDQSLIRASSRAEIAQVVCAELTRVETYSFAWIGAYEPADNRIDPREHAGTGGDYLDAVAFDTGADPAEETPAAAAVRTGEPQIENAILTDPPQAQWRQEALKRGFRSAITLPLQYRDSLYGILTIFSGESDVFEGMESQVLIELSETIAYAMNAVESKKALVSEEIVELEFRTDPAEYPLLALTEGGDDRRFDLKGIVPSETDVYRIFYTVSGVSADHLREAVAESTTVKNSEIIAERTDRCLVESTLTADSVFFWLLDRGTIPRSVAIEDGEAYLRVELPDTADVRDFVELFQGTYPNVELVARRASEPPVYTRAEFESVFEEALTPRQLEILRTAYYSGYFNTPRDRTGSDIASALGISQPTFSDHLRTSLKKLLTLLFTNADGSPDDPPTERTPER